MILSSVRPREETIALLDWRGPKGGRPSVGKWRDYSLFKSMVVVSGPPDQYPYTDEDLELLARFVDRLDEHKQKMFGHQGRREFYSDTNWIEFSKWGHPADGDYGWTCRRQSWTSGGTKPTLAQGISRFYLGELLDKNWWVCGEDLKPHVVVKMEFAVEIKKLDDGRTNLRPLGFLLAAPSRDEMLEMIAYYEFERETKAAARHAKWGKQA